MSSDSWPEYEKLVIGELERLNTSVDKINDRLEKQNTELALLKLKSSLWGTVGGAVTVIGTTLFEYFKK